MTTSIGSLFRRDAFLALASGAMLGLSFPPSPIYTLAYVAFIPMLLLMERATSYLSFARSGYLFGFIFHAITLYWTGGFTHMRDPWMMAAGASLIVIHPLFYLPGLLGARWIRKRLGLAWGVAAFVIFWVAFEYVHALGEFSFPWITIGNSQAYDIPRIQIAEFISVFGISGILLTFNALGFVLMLNLAERTWTVRSGKGLLTVVVLLVVYIGPWIVGSYRMRMFDGNLDPKVMVGVLQPNIDPWEKWGTDRTSRWHSYDRQFQWHRDATTEISRNGADLVVWSETAVPFHLLDPRFAEYRTMMQRLVDSTNCSVFTGLPSVTYFSAGDAPATARPIDGTGMFYESYNSAVVFSPRRREGPVYHKVILVPFAERIPYASSFRFLIDPLRWNVGIGSWGKGTDTVVHEFPLRDGSKATFGGLICYETAYPNFVRLFVRRGAQFLTVITNDSWWGRTSGAYQHASFATLRAIETRRWVVQCANGGISLVVRPNGIVDHATKLYSEDRFTASVGLSSVETAYVKWGDVVGLAFLGSALGLCLWGLVGPGIVKRKKQNETNC